MKKSRFLALMLVAAVMLMGAGYAYWTDNLYVTTTVNTGELDLYFDNTVTESAISWNDDNNDVAYGTITYEEITADEPNSTATVTFNNIYPGATADLTLDIINDSTIPVRFESLGFTNNTTLSGITITKELIIGEVTYDLDNLDVSSIPNIPAGSDLQLKIYVSFAGASIDSEDSTTSFTFNPQFTQFNK